MSELTTRQVDGYTIVTSGKLQCPSREACDQRSNETYEQYVRRHCLDHELGEFESLDDAERNLGLNCSYYDHKYLWGNPTLTASPHWEMHAFLDESCWAPEDLEQGVPLDKRSFVLPPAGQRKPGIYRRFKQVEVSRETQKTAIGGRHHVIFRQKREYFVHGRRNFRQILRSASVTIVRGSLRVIRRMGTANENYKRLYGAWSVVCRLCGRRGHTRVKANVCSVCAGAGVPRDKQKLSQRWVSLIDNGPGGNGASGKDECSFRWLSGSADSMASCNLAVFGLRSVTVGQRPDEYIWDDPQDEKNCNTPEKRAFIAEQFDESVRQLEHEDDDGRGGEMLVLDTPKHLDDYTCKIAKAPLSDLFHSFRRPARWVTTETDCAPFVVAGMRYYYPIKGDGKRALDAKALDKHEKQMAERRFAAEYLIDPLDQARATFKYEHFPIVKFDDAPPEIRFGLGCDVSPQQQQELDALNLRIVAINACDPAGIEEQKKLGDANFIVAARIDRYGKLWITRLVMGKWVSSRIWSEIEKAAQYNNAQFTDYEMPASEVHIKNGFEKWCRDQSEARSALNESAVAVSPAIKFSHMPKSTKRARIDSMETRLPIYILDNAGGDDPEVIATYRHQWVALGVTDHDDGPDATSRLSRYLTGKRYVPPAEKEEEAAAGVSLAAIKAAAGLQKPGPGVWGERGGVTRAA
jgi:ribosomal protein L37E